MVQSNEQLNRECSLFTDDGRYVIVGSAAHIPDELRPHFYQVRYWIITFILTSLFYIIYNLLYILYFIYNIKFYFLRFILTMKH